MFMFPQTETFALNMLSARRTASWLAAFQSDIYSLWQGTKFEAQVSEMSFFRGLMSFYNSESEAIESRRELCFNYLAQQFTVYDEKGRYLSDAPLARQRSTLEVPSFVTKVLGEICKAYDPPPERIFSKNETVNNELVNFYRDANANGRLAEAEAISTYCGVAAVRPVRYGTTGRVALEVYDPSQFRVWVDSEDPKAATEMWLHYRDPNTGKNYFKYWDADFYRLYDSEKKLIKEDVNRYGRIPFAFMRINGGGGFYGSSLYDVFEDNLTDIRLRYIAAQGVAYQTGGIAILMNADIPSAESFVMSPDRLIIKNNVRDGEGETLPPEVSFSSPDTSFQTVEETIKERYLAAVAKQGIPKAVASGETSSASGIARKVERAPLIEMREKSFNELISFERELASLVGLVLRFDYDRAVISNYDNSDFTVRFADVREYQEPAQELDFDLKKVEAGLMSKVELFQKWTGKADATEADFLAVLELNKKMSSTPETAQAPPTVGGDPATPPVDATGSDTQQGVQ